ncbi:MAG: prepilin-type N-terminal cleavage/methylation domain-containing protein [Gammaproteobacteria bacterium]
MTRANGGMTLIEVLVALTVLSLLSAGMIGAFRLGQRTFDRVTRIDRAHDDVGLVQQFLRTTLESAYPFEPEAGKRAEATGLEGTSTRLLVTAPGNSAGTDSGNRRFIIDVMRERDGSESLTLTSALDRNGARDIDARHARTEVLIPRIESVEWSYLDAAEGNNWSAHWSERHPPALVRLRVQFPAGDLRRWPDFVVAPRVTDDANCVFDVIAQGCRENGG